jgi:hypothetical protein
MYSLSIFVTIFANYVMGFPVSPGIEFDVTVLGVCLARCAAKMYI